MDAPGSVIGAFRGTIVTLGGGGFSMSETGESAIDDWLLDRAGRRVAAAQPHSPALPRVCFVPTASGDSRDYIERFEAAFTGRAQTHVLSLFGQSPWGYREPEMLAEMDLVYVGGGSTVNLLALWRTHGVDDVLRRAAATGTILAGISAGANCWFETSSTDSFGPLAPLRDGLGFLPGSACPHHHGEEGRAETFRTWIADGTLSDPGFGLDDGAAAVFTDGALTSVVTEDPVACVHLVEGETETPLESTLLA